MRSDADSTTAAFEQKQTESPEVDGISKPDCASNVPASSLKWSAQDNDLLNRLSSDTNTKAERFLKRERQFTEYQRREILAGRGDGLVYGNYVVQDLRGKGGEARVFKAFDVRSERVEAVKVFLSRGLDEDDLDSLRRRFDQGLAASARLNHPNVVRTLSYQLEPVLLAMEFVEGPDLGAKAGVDPSHDPGSAPIQVAEVDAIEWIRQAARGLQHGHENNVIHRDVKPSNLLFDEDREIVRVADWGLARIDDDRTRITDPNHALGSCYWKSPEQSLRPDAVDRRADIYSLGATLFSILTGTVPYTGETSVMVELAHVEQPIPCISDYRPVSPQLENVFQEMVAKEPGKRIPDMAAVIEALNACQSPTDVTSKR